MMQTCQRPKNVNCSGYFFTLSILCGIICGLCETIRGKRNINRYLWDTMMEMKDTMVHVGHYWGIYVTIKGM